MLYIQKKEKPRDAIRINSENDIPDFLKDTISIKDGQIKCLAAEGYNYSPLGTIIGFDRNAPTITGKGAWPIHPESLIERDGLFYPKPDIRKAKRLPSPYSYETPWGLQILEADQIGFLIYSQYEVTHILTMGTSSADDYMVCDKDGNNICTLNEYVETHIIDVDFDELEREDS